MSALQWLGLVLAWLALACWLCDERSASSTHAEEDAMGSFWRPPQKPGG